MKNDKFCPSSSETTNSAPGHEGRPTARDKRRHHRPVATGAPPSTLSPAGSRAQFPPL